MLDKLNSKLDLRKHYTSHNIDYISRMANDASSEDFLEYYDDMIHIDIDSSSNITTLTVKAFNPQLSQEMAKTIMKESEDLVNKLSDRIIDDTLRFARNEVDKAEERVKSASNALTEFRTKTQSIDPDKETGAALGIIAGLESKLVDTRAQLSETLGFMQKDSPQVKVLQDKVRALERQVRDERERMTTKGGRDYTQLIDQYQPLILEQELAKQRYSTALTSLVAARAEAQHKQRYLLSFVQPQIPDEAELPERFKSTVIIFFELCLLYGIGGLVWAAIKDHMRL